MKRATALIFLLLANIIMLAHVFVPHCDYNSKTSASISMQVVQPENDTNCCSCENYHHKHGIDEECVLTQDYIKNGKDDKTTSFADFILLAYPFIHVNNSIPTTDSELLSFQYQPYLLSYYCVSILPATGLRAPPTC
ncbi:MAG: hypothetical protein LBE11_02925 [Prevotellaceae bacterium]|jgi:hypothetical protein|nr:hypothetical protein [Prevotellaceae bacterium]